MFERNILYIRSYQQIFLSDCPSQENTSLLWPYKVHTNTKYLACWGLFYGQNVNPDNSPLVTQRWATSGKFVSPPEAATSGSPTFCPLSQHWPTGTNTPVEILQWHQPVRLQLYGHLWIRQMIGRFWADLS